MNSKIIPVLLLASPFLAALFSSCTINNGPVTPTSPSPSVTSTIATSQTPTQTSTATPTATPSITPTPNTPIIMALIGSINGPQASVCVADATGNSGTSNTSVTLITQGVSLPLTYIGIYPVYLNAPTGIGLPDITGGQYINGITYVPGQVYEVDVNINGVVYSDSITAIGASPQAAVVAGNLGVACSWTSGVGNEDYITVNGTSASTQLGPNLTTSPVTLSNAYFTDETPGSGQDYVVLGILQVTPGFPGCQSSSRIAAYQPSALLY